MDMRGPKLQQPDAQDEDDVMKMTELTRLGGMLQSIVCVQKPQLLPVDHLHVRVAVSMVEVH